MKNKISTLVSFVVSSLIFVGCGGGGGGGTVAVLPVSTQATDSATLKDSIISGVDYDCDGVVGVSDIKGKVEFSTDCSKLSFSIGDVILGSILTKNINPDRVIYPADLLNLDRNDTANYRLGDLVQFLQSLDDDLDPNNGISIKDAKKDLVKNSEFDFTNSNDSYERFKHMIGLRLVDRNSAISHYESTIRRDLSLQTDTVPPVVPDFNDSEE